MSGGYFGAFTPGGTQYNAYGTPAGFPANAYNFAPPPVAATGYATAFQHATGGGAPRQAESSSVFAYATRPGGGSYVTGAQPIYASPFTAAASGVASIIAGLSAAPSKAAMTTGGGVGGVTVAPTSTKTSTPATGTATYTGYDAAVYAAATSYLQSKATGGGSNWLGLRRGGGGGGGGGGSTSGSAGYGGGSGGGGRGSFPRKTTSSRSLQLHYCEICKISCAGPQTYKEHLEGQKHKKKEAQAQGGELPPIAKSKASFRCDLCGVTCTGQDTYNAHVRGAKHLKTVKLHQTLGKPIPSTEPTVIPPSNARKSLSGSTGSGTASGSKKIIGVSKVEFVGGQKLTTMGVSSGATVKVEPEDPSLYLSLEKEPEPVGGDYVELVKSDDGKSTQYFCKLCDCRFNDMNAKDMHLKGRRHRFQFKKKVNPELEVELKVTPKNRRFSEEKPRKDRYYQQRDCWGAQTPYHSQMPPQSPLISTGPSPLFGTSRQAFSSDMDEQFIMKKHASIYPSEEETKAVLTMVSNVEQALKAVSDHFFEEEKRKKEEEEKSKKEKETPATDETEASDAPPDNDNTTNTAPAAVEKATSIKTTAAASDERLLRGAMRVGTLSSGLMLRGDPSVHLVVLCSEIPTVTLLKKIAALLTHNLEDIADGVYDVFAAEKEAAINVTSSLEKITVIVSLTSILMRDPTGGGGEAANKPDPIDMLDKQKCLESLASLRHAKWFQARCANLPSCSLVLRLLRDLSQRLPTWTLLNPWASELLVEKVLSSAGVALSPYEAFRCLFEAIAAGILLPGGPGLLDPCEKEKVDAAATMTQQQREDITASAQHALRLIAFKQIYKVLGIDRSAIKAPAQRKRPLDEVVASEGSENGKKDKKEEMDTSEQSPSMTTQESLPIKMEAA